jgi:nondiscriminating aspartyl-tRNA synthetase
MKREEELGDWRRTHYSIDMAPELDGQAVTLFGWVSSRRTHRGIDFILLSDKEGAVQITVHKKNASRQLLEKLDVVTEHSSLGIRGIVKATPKAIRGAEVVPTEIKLLGLATTAPPFSVFGGELPSLEKRLDIRPIDLRRDKAQAIFRIQRQVLKSVREFFLEKGCLEIRTPKLIATASEGGAALFSVLYYNRPAFLTQSPQIYKEHMVMPFEKVFEIGPAFRAEESRTQRHLSEITSIDMEQAFVDYNDVMDTLEELITHVVREVGSRCRSDYEKLRKKPPECSEKFVRISYDQALGLAADAGAELSWGEDIAGAALEALERANPGFCFVTDWPTSSKPFYIKPSRREPKISESFDLMHGSLELASGGSRISTKRQLVKRLKEQKLKPEAFDYHLKVFDYGMPPHAGFGLGLERFMMVLVSEQNIREVTLYPRDKLRITP